MTCKVQGKSGFKITDPLRVVDNDDTFSIIAGDTCIMEIDHVAFPTKEHALAVATELRRYCEYTEFPFQVLT